MVAARSSARSARAKSRASQTAPALQAPQVGAIPPSKIPPPALDGGSTPKPQPLASRALVAALTATSKSWGRGMWDGSPAADARMAIVHALGICVALLTTWTTPSGAEMVRRLLSLVTPGPRPCAVSHDTAQAPSPKLAPVAVEPTEEQLVAALEASPAPVVVTFLRVDDAGRTWALGPSDL